MGQRTVAEIEMEAILHQKEKEKEEGKQNECSTNKKN